MSRASRVLVCVAWAVVPPLGVAALVLLYYGFPANPTAQSLGWSLAVAYGAYIVWAWGTNRSIQLAASTLAVTGGRGVRIFALLVGIAHICAGTYMLVR